MHTYILYYILVPIYSLLVIYFIILKTNGNVQDYTCLLDLVCVVVGIIEREIFLWPVYKGSTNSTCCAYCMCVYFLKMFFLEIRIFIMKLFSNSFASWWNYCFKQCKHNSRNNLVLFWNVFTWILLLEKNVYCLYWKRLLRLYTYMVSYYYEVTSCHCVNIVLNQSYKRLRVYLWKTSFVVRVFLHLLIP